MSDKTDLRQHDWREMKVTPVEVVDGVAISIGGDSEITIGCFNCNMGLDEGKDIACPGFDAFEIDPADIDPEDYRLD